MKSLAAAFFCAAFCAAAAAAPERPADEPQRGVAVERSAAARSGESAAVAALLDSVDEELAASHPQQALALLERALRIEPRNPALWHYLGIANLELGRYAQAEAMAAKSRSLAGGNRTLRTRNAGLTAEALRAQGKPVPEPRREVASLAARADTVWQLWSRRSSVTRQARDGVATERVGPERAVPRLAPGADRRAAPRLAPGADRRAAPRLAPRNADRRSARRYGSNGFEL